MSLIKIGNCKSPLLKIGILTTSLILLTLLIPTNDFYALASSDMVKTNDTSVNTNVSEHDISKINSNSTGLGLNNSYFNK